MRRPPAHLILTGLLLLPRGTWAEATPGVGWSVERRDVGYFDWRTRVVTGPEGGAWIGGAVAPGVPGGLLYRFRDGHWDRFAATRVEAMRTFVLDVDPTGTLWLCPYSPSQDVTYEGLRISRFDGRSWREEVVRPGLWPQVMDMVSDHEGWIGGNRGQLLHLRGGRWRKEPLALAQPAGKNILALRMSDPGHGWLAGKSGLVARYLEGRWRVLPVPAALAREDFFDLDVTPAGDLWLVGTQGKIVRFDGRSWTRFSNPKPFNLLGLDMVSDREGWAVGEYGTILRWDGTTWHPWPSPTLSDLYSVAMTGSGEGWIAANDRLLRASARRSPWFREVEPGRSSAVRDPGRKVAALDADGDGDLDLFSMQPTSIRLYANLGPEGFLAVRGLTAPAGALLQGASWGDVDGDGDLDLVLLGRVPNRVWLYRNQGDLRFTPPVAIANAPLGGDDSAALVDFDGDGPLDLYLARSTGTNVLPNLLLRNDGTGRFQIADAETGRESIERFTLWGDVDGDLDLDVVLSGNGNEVRLLLNHGGRLRDVTRESGIGGIFDPGQMTQGALVDLDRDGDLDLFLLGNFLYVFQNDGKARFRLDAGLFGEVFNNPSISSTLSAVGDLDGDGDPEVLLQPVEEGRRVLRLFARGEDGRYHDVSHLAGLEEVTGNAAVFADWDGDGDLDLFVAGEEGSHLFENQRNDPGFLDLHLRGDRGNRSAVGARVALYEAGHLGERAFLRGFQQAGAGFNPSGFPDPGRLHFGLDPGRSYDLEVTFPGGRRRVLRSLQPGRHLTLDESPPGLRQAFLAARWLRRTASAADPVMEGTKLAFVLLALALWHGLAPRRFGALLLAPRWSLAGVFLLAYLLVAGWQVAEPRALAQSAQVLGLVGALGALTLADRGITRWRASHYLGPYRLQEALGEGGMGVVYRARDVVARRTVALKVLHPRRLEQEEHRLRFLREAQILTRLEHPNIVQVFATGEIGGRGYIAMELLEGLSLRKLVRRHGPLSPEAVRALLVAACDALAYVHARGVLHRDVKSDNLFVFGPLETLPTDEAGWRKRVRLMDFGLARAVGMSSLTARPGLLGTLAYLPPEQARGGALDVRSDLYSLGVLAYEALTGRLPFEADDEATLLARIQAGEPVPAERWRPEIPDLLAWALRRLLARDPADRPASAEDLGDLLQGRIRRPEPAPAEGGDSPWQLLFREARRAMEEGAATRAQVLMVECLAELKNNLQTLEPAERDLYCRRHQVAAALDFMDRLSREGGEG